MIFSFNPQANFHSCDIIRRSYIIMLPLPSRVRIFPDDSKRLAGSIIPKLAADSNLSKSIKYIRLLRFYFDLQLLIITALCD